MLLSAWDGGWVSPFLWRRCSCGQRLCPCRPSWPSSLGGLHCSIAAYVGCVRPERPSPFRGARSPCSAAPGRPEVQTHPQGGTRGTRGFPAPSVAKDRHLQLLPPRGGPRTHLVSGWARRVSRGEGGVRTRVLAHVLEGSSVSPSEESSHRGEALPASLREGARFCGSGRCTEALPPDWSWCGCPGVSSPSQWLGRGRGGPRAWVSRTSGTVSAGAPGSARARLSWGAGDDTGSTHGEAGLGRGDTSWVPHASPGPPLTPPVTAGTSPEGLWVEDASFPLVGCSSPRDCRGGGWAGGLGRRVLSLEEDLSRPEPVGEADWTGLGDGWPEDAVTGAGPRDSEGRGDKRRPREP